ncbi:MAG: hypothetical protein K6F55_04140 [Eubacterium sp.]|nr:hypothetical protein [Eubacterium sp.]
MENSEKNFLRRFTDKLFGGLDISWMMLIIYAMGTAILTALFLIIPGLENTSFERMGVYPEAWIFFAVIIMANCKKPLESALKTFVFFLISQPLIYLFQVPFSWMGWELFKFYFFWFKVTLCTFPGAFIGWFITKRNWLSVLILLPVIAFLLFTTYQCAIICITAFPRLLLATLFCILQVVLYVYAFFPWYKRKKAE